MTAAAVRPRALLRVVGIVQGVGFRPFVHRLATRLGLDGWARNGAGMVDIALEGDAQALAAFRRALAAEAPPLARIDDVRELPLHGDVAPGFHIVESEAPRHLPQLVPADVALCAACERELRDPADRRHGHAFIACTDCGPRFSVIDAMPYDRVRTTMRAFPLCDACAAEYRSPTSRRFHAEATSCPACGPHTALVTAGGHTIARDGDAIVRAASLLAAGAVVAVRGIGGFHLAVDATSPEAVALLRRRKHREAKPLAVMVRSLAEARAIAVLSAEEERWLTCPAGPIVVAARRPGAPVAAGVSGGLATVGVMLPYSPLHLLLVEAAGTPLVMTSGNLSMQPLVAEVDDARATLGDVADAFLVHDRAIANAIDDSVVRVAGGVPVLLRRARGFAPLPVALPSPAPVPLLAVGAHLKNTFTLAAGRQAWLSQHVGDLETLETGEHWERLRRRYEAIFHVAPRVVVRDLHPEYESSRMAERLALDVEAERVLAVQHHHAHVAAVAGEHGETGPVVGIALDGVGYGADGCIWGAELLVATPRAYRRAGHLRYAPLPGGDAAGRAAWRAALGYVSLEPSVFPESARRFAGVDQRAVALTLAQAAARLNAPMASSTGRLFDAAAALLGVCTASRYEGEAAMRLEAAAGARAGGRALPFPVVERDGLLEMDPIPLLAALVARREAGADPATLAAAFHDAVARTLVRAATQVAAGAGLDVVALGGGAIQNARLLTSIRDGLAARGLRVLVARALPPNDGAISYGQAVVAAALLA